MPIDRSEHGVIGNAAETDGTVSFNGIESTVTNLLWVCGEMAYHNWLLPSCSEFESQQTHQIFGTIAGRSSIGLLILR
jgi:hypothetical protein